MHKPAAVVAFHVALSFVSVARAEPVDLDVAGTLSGNLEDMSQVTNKSGYTFQVLMRGLKYQGQLTRTVVETTGEGQFTVWMGVRNFYVRIERTDISGQPGRAVCGPLDLVLGNQRELWIGYDVETQVDEQDESKMSLLLRSTRFRLPPDNWSIGSPAWVQTSGFGMSRGNVVNGIRRGLAENRERIAGRVIKSGPAIFAQAAALTDRLPPLVTPVEDSHPNGQFPGEALTTLGDPSSREWRQPSGP